MCHFVFKGCKRILDRTGRLYHVGFGLYVYHNIMEIAVNCVCARVCVCDSLPQDCHRHYYVCVCIHCLSMKKSQPKKKGYRI